MRQFYIIYLFFFIAKIAVFQEADRTRKQNNLGFKIVNIGDKYTIQDSLDDYVVKDTFDFVTLESVRSWGKKRFIYALKNEV